MAFFAIPFPHDLQARITEQLAPLKKAWPDIQWSHPADYHFTLRFLGGLQPEAMSRLLVDVQGTGLAFSPFTLNLQGLFTFPAQRDRGVLWMGLSFLDPALIDLQKRLEETVQVLGFEAEKRPFTPHLTIGRFHSRETEALTELLPQFAEQNFGSHLCREYVLMKRRSGARENSGQPLYEVLTRFSV